MQFRNRSVIINKDPVPLTNSLFKNERNEEINLAGFYSADLHSYYIQMWMQKFAKSIKPNNALLRNEAYFCFSFFSHYVRQSGSMSLINAKYSIHD